MSYTEEKNIPGVALFVDLTFFQNGQEICFSNATFKDCVQFCCQKTRLEIQNLITIVLRWPTWIILNAKQTSF